MNLREFFFFFLSFNCFFFFSYCLKKNYYQYFAVEGLTVCECYHGGKSGRLQALNVISSRDKNKGYMNKSQKVNNK